MYKILVFGMTENPGGVESVIMNYYHYMDKNTFHFDFLCNSYNKIAFEEEIISNGSQTFHFPARSKNYKKYKKELMEVRRTHIFSNKSDGIMNLLL